VPWRRLAVLGAAVALAVTVWWWRARRRRRAGGRGASLEPLGPQAVARLYRRCLDRLAAHGYRRRPAETPHELAERIAAAAVRDADAFVRLTDLYVQARFGRREVDDRLVTALGRRLQHLGASERLSGIHRAA
jgi:hypothetical protein